SSGDTVARSKAGPVTGGSEQPELLFGAGADWDRFLQDLPDRLEVRTQRGHLRASLPAAVQHGRGMEGRDHRPALDREALATDATDRDLLVEDHARGEVPERDDDAWRDVLDLPGEVWAAGFDLVGERIAVPGWPAFHDVADVDVLAAKADLAEQSGEQLPGRSHERLALLVLVIAGALPDEHHTGVGVPHAEHDLRPAAGQPAPRAGRSLVRQLIEGLGHASLPSVAEGKPGTLSARSTARLMASFTASSARDSSVRCSASTGPVARTKAVSPSHIVCAGRIAPAMPSWAASESRCARSLDRFAFVATTTRVVLIPGSVASPSSGPPPSASSPGRAPATASPWSSTISP